MRECKKKTCTNRAMVHGLCGHHYTKWWEKVYPLKKREKPRHWRV